jgi:hypothetical protein
MEFMYCGQILMFNRIVILYIDKQTNTDLILYFK